jgi:hypothetical protein
MFHALRESWLRGEGRRERSSSSSASELGGGGERRRAYHTPMTSMGGAQGGYETPIRAMARAPSSQGWVAAGGHYRLRSDSAGGSSEAVGGEFSPYRHINWSEEVDKESPKSCVLFFLLFFY